MNFDFLPEQAAVANAVRQALQDAGAEDLRRLETLPLPDRRARIEALRERLADAEGYLTHGRGRAHAATWVHWLAGAEVLAASSTPAFLGIEITARLFGAIAEDLLPPPSREVLLPALDTGSVWGAVALSDADEETPTRILQGGDGQMRLQGTKAHVTAALWADWIAVLARDAQDRPTLAVLERKSPGLRVGEPLETLGLRALPVSPVWLEDVPVSRHWVSAPLGGEAPTESLQRVHDLLLAVAGVGLIHQSFERAKEHANTHRRGGKPIMAYQAVRFALAEMLTLLQTAELTVRRATWMCSAPEDPEAAEADTLVRVAKTFAAESAEQVAQQALTLMAAQGYLAPNPVEAAHRDAPYVAIAGTAPSLARLQIAETLLARAAR